MVADFIHLLGLEPPPIGTLEMGQTGPTPAAEFVQWLPEVQGWAVCREALRVLMDKYRRGEQRRLGDLVYCFVELEWTIPEPDRSELWDLAEAQRDGRLVHALAICEAKTGEYAEDRTARLDRALAWQETDMHLVLLGDYGQGVAQGGLAGSSSAIASMIDREMEYGDCGAALFVYYLAMKESGKEMRVASCGFVDRQTEHLREVVRRHENWQGWDDAEFIEFVRGLVGEDG